MGWTQQHRDRTRRFRHRALADGPPPSSPRPVAAAEVDGPHLGITHILRRRARWVGARLRRPSPR